MKKKYTNRLFTIYQFRHHTQWSPIFTVHCYYLVLFLMLALLVN